MTLRVFIAGRPSANRKASRTAFAGHSRSLQPACISATARFTASSEPRPTLVPAALGNLYGRPSLGWSALAWLAAQASSVCLPPPRGHTREQGSNDDGRISQVYATVSPSGRTRCTSFTSARQIFVSARSRRRSPAAEGPRRHKLGTELPRDGDCCGEMVFALLGSRIAACGTTTTNACCTHRSRTHGDAIVALGSYASAGNIPRTFLPLQ